MEKLIVVGNGPLYGEVVISGAKNAALPIMCASLLTAEPLDLHNVPMLKDIETCVQILSKLGATVSRQEDLMPKMHICCDHIRELCVPYELVRAMRASILILGPALARFGQCHISLPGGCAIGSRPIDQHIKGLRAMGAEIEVEHGYIRACAKRLKGAHIIMDMVTVTGTENLLMAACLAEGDTILENAAKEPEVTDLAECLVKMGAQIKGLGSDVLCISGVERLHGAYHCILSDRIEAGTFLCALAMTQGELVLKHVHPASMQMVLDKLIEAGMSIQADEKTITASMRERTKPVDIRTLPYPGFPTDMQAQFVSMNAVAQGNSRVIENIFENRFMHVPELTRMGAAIEIQGNVALIDGVERLSGATVMATDLRASASLVIAGLVAEDETTIEQISHLDRGYQKIEEKLGKIGAKIKRVA